MAGRRGGGDSPWKQILAVVAGVMAVCVGAGFVTATPTGRAALEALGLDSGASLSAGSDASTGNNLTVTLPGVSGSASAGSPDATPGSGSTGSGSPNAGSTDSGSASWPSAASSPVSYADALGMARGATVAQPHTDGYDRATVFGGWAKSDSAPCSGANTRDVVLARDLDDAAWSDSCHVKSGSLRDPYTGATIRFTRGKSTSSAVQIDHVVALQDAWASGAWQWSQDKRVAYANSPDVLLAVDGPANEAKGSGVASLAGGKADADRVAWGGEVWLPSNGAYRCDYMAKRAWIKNTYGLSMTGEEKSQTVSVLEACAAR